MKAQQGIEVRHQRGCTSRSGGRCDCSPQYRASVWDPKTKKSVRRTFGTVTEAKRWRQDAKVDLRRGVLADPSSPTIAAAAETWMTGARRGAIRNRSGHAYKPGVLRLYEQVLRDHVLPALGSTKVSELQRSEVQHLVDHLVESGLSASTVRNALMPLRAICRRAMTRGSMSTNPTHGLELPAHGSGRDRVASPLEAHTLLMALPEADRSIWATAFYAGLRVGEQLALRERDVDLVRSVIHVERSWDRVEGPVLPKSAAGLRVVPIAAALREHLPPLTGEPDRLLFGRSAVLPFSPAGVVDRAHRLWTAAGLRTITPHECRHTFASLMIAAGVNIKALQVFMGHASITVTLDRYGHLLPGSESEAADLLDAFLAAQRAAGRGENAGESDPVSSPLQPA